jgi:hypothetical protein
MRSFIVVSVVHTGERMAHCLPLDVTLSTIIGARASRLRGDELEVRRCSTVKVVLE